MGEERPKDYEARRPRGPVLRIEVTSPRVHYEPSPEEKARAKRRKREGSQ
jgi:hypothetical protein